MTIDGDAGVGVVGNGWLGRSLGETFGCRPFPRRSFGAGDLDGMACVAVASGRSGTPARADRQRYLDEELGHLGAVLDACEHRAVARVVVLGSCDVAGMAPEITGTTPPDPRSSK